MDYLSLKAAVSEAGKKISGSKISDTWQSGPGEIVLVTRNGPGLLLSIDPGRPGLYLVDSTELPGRIPSPFTDLLRVRIKGTTIGSIHMPQPGERIVILTFATAWPAVEGTPLTMVLEVMGRRSNLVILEEERILVPLKPVPKERSPVRPVVAGEIYHPPPSRSGTPVEEVDLTVLPTLTTAEPAHELMKSVQGLSPYTALQAVMMADKRSAANDAGANSESIAATIREMAASCTGETGFLHRSGGKVHLVPFEPLSLATSDTVDRYSPFSEAAAVWKSTDLSGTVEGHDETAYLKKGLGERIKRFKSALEHVAAEEERCQGHNEARIMAEALLINVAGIAHGVGSVILPNPYDPGLELNIPLERTKNPQENANDLFSRARRMKRGLDEVHTRRRKLTEEMKEAQKALEALTAREDPGPAREVLDVKTHHTGRKRRAAAAPYSGPGRRQTVDGFTILVGKSSTDNEKVTFKAAGPNDLWLHARDYPGSHVVILTEKRQVPDKVLYAAAALTAKWSGAKNDTAPEIMVTERKWVRKIKGGKPGMVTVERFRTIRPRIQNPESRSQKK
jgi:predicted ribosome quality control (RQC) complex YloA/Tae2 family protein